MANTPKRGRSLASVMGTLDDEAGAAAPAAPAPASAAPKAAGIVAINMLVSPADRHRIRQLSLDTGLSVQKLGHEAWNLLLRSRGLDPLEPTTANVPSGGRRRGEG